MSRPATVESGEALRGTVLVVDDEKNIRRALRMVLEGEGVEVIDATRGEQALELIAPGPDLPPARGIEVMIIDVKMPGMSGLEVLEELTRGGREPPVPVILISGHATVADAVRATRLGAFDFFEKPLERDRVLVSVRNALRQAHTDRELRALRDRVRGEIIGESEVIAKLLAQVDKVGPTKARVLISGESGTGKELIARAVHEASDRRERPFVKVNCAAIPRELIESELFGHERGAFTGATAMKKGLFEVAHGGTIFLDEIGDMDLDAQAKVLRVLQTGEFMRVGGNQPLTCDVRVLAATHRNLEELVRGGEFREDLFFRLAVVPLEVPPLRERREDVAALAVHFIDQACDENGVAPRRISQAALARLVAHDWPGNVRQLRNVIERMVVLSSGDLELEDVPEGIGGDAPPRASDDDEVDDDLEPRLAELLQMGGDASLKEVREAVERAYIVARLKRNGWNVSQTAKELGLERSHLHRKMRLYRIERGQE